MVDQETRAILGYNHALDSISSLAAAIAYASITGRVDKSLNMAHTLVQLIHACTDNKAVSFNTVDMDDKLARDIARSVAASVYIAKFQYESWVQEDSKDDS